MARKAYLRGLCLMALICTAPAGAADGPSPAPPDGAAPLPAYRAPQASSANKSGVPRPSDMIELGEPDRVEIEHYSDGLLETRHYGADVFMTFFPKKDSSEPSADGGNKTPCVPGAIYNTVPPSISGTPSPGYVLEVSRGGWHSCGMIVERYSFLWSTGATGQYYAVQSGDAGRQVNARVTACNAENCAEATSNTVTISNSPPPPPPPGGPQADIWANATSIAPGERTTIHWACTNSDQAQATGGDSRWQGYRTLTGDHITDPLYGNTTYTIQCFGGGTVATNSVTIAIGGGGGSCSENDPSQLHSEFTSVQAPPASIAPGQAFSVSITVRNTGQCTWTRDGGYKLGSQNPENTTNWGSNRVELSVGESVLSGQSRTFVVDAVAPSTPGTYGFQWRMVREFVNWFGPNSPNFDITVTGSPPPPPPPPPSCSGIVILYDGPDFTGTCWSYGVGERSTLGDADNRASSIKVAEGYVATLFPQTSFAGTWANTVTAANASGWSGVGDNNASSLVVQQEQAPEQLVQSTLVSPPAESRTSYPNRCWNVWDGFSTYSQYGRRAFTYKLSTNFCKVNRKITFVGSREITVDIPPFPFPLNLINQWRYSQSFFQEGEAGVSSTILKVQGVFDLCVFRYGCALAYTEWIKIELYGDGRAICTNSENQTPRNCARKLQ